MAMSFIRKLTPEVRRRWAEVVEPLVVAAKERHEADVELPSMLDTAAAAAAIRARRVRVERTAAGPQGEELHVVLALDSNLKAQFRVVVDDVHRRGHIRCGHVHAASAVQ